MPLPSLIVLAAGAAPEAAEQQLLDIDGTLFLQLGLFAALAFLLSRFLFKPYLRVRADRVARVEGYRTEAAKLEAEAATRLAKCEADLGEARRAGSGFRAEARAVAHAREQAILAEATTAAQTSLAEARARVEAALATERAALPAKAAEIGRQASRKILGREVSP